MPTERPIKDLRGSLENASDEAVREAKRGNVVLVDNKSLCVKVETALDREFPTKPKVGSPIRVRLTDDVRTLRCWAIALVPVEEAVRK